MSINTNTNLTAGSLELFLDLANDAGNWSGQPLFGGNVGGDQTSKGHLTDLKKKGFITTDLDEGDVWVQFTETGKALAAKHGVEL